ncbi:MAG: ABC transporter permease subunit [Nanoarchaeota archaeon]|nr:ABC transporter permease subunit [Nanoarchaeota archaeon]
MISKFKILSYVKWFFSYLIVIAAVIFAVFPIYYIVVMSLSKIPALTDLSLSSLVPTPSSITLSAFSDILFHSDFLIWLRNSLILGTSTVIIALIVALLAGIGLSRLSLPGKKALVVTIYILTFFPFTAIAIPLFLMFASLHLINQFTGLILAYSAGTAMFGAYMSKIFLDSVPKEYEEAAMVDGLSRSKAFFRVLLPMAKPIIAFLALLAFMGAYTDYALANVFLISNNKWTLTLGLYYLAVTKTNTLYNVFAAYSLLMGLPIFVVFIVFQRYLTQMYSMSGTK